ncbi:MAG: hypothetical protein ACLR23_01415 [Clostridia bacterium]
MSLEQENLNYRELVEELQLEILRFKEQGKMNREWLPELLSPAGDMDCLKAAVDAGCDAVYLGAANLTPDRARAIFRLRRWRRPFDIVPFEGSRRI